VIGSLMATGVALDSGVTASLEDVLLAEGKAAESAGAKVKLIAPVTG